MPSPPHNPYKSPILEHEVDLEFGDAIPEYERIELRRASNIVSCAGFASDISSEHIMWMIEY